jgi:hypothetical protein
MIRTSVLKVSGLFFSGIGYLMTTYYERALNGPPPGGRMPATCIISREKV